MDGLNRRLPCLSVSFLLYFPVVVRNMEACVFTYDKNRNDKEKRKK